MKDVTHKDLWALQDQTFEIDDRLMALESMVVALMLALDEAGLLPRDRLVRHLCAAANQLEEGGLKEAAQALDAWRSHLDALFPAPPARGGDK